MVLIRDDRGGWRVFIGPASTGGTDGVADSSALQAALAGDAAELVGATRMTSPSTATAYVADPVDAGGERAQMAMVIGRIMDVLVPLKHRMEQAQTVLAQVQEDSSFEQQVVDLVNAERSRFGLGGLGYRAELDLAAERHNDRQAATSTMAHAGIGDASPGDRVMAVGFRKAWGENVAAGQTSPAQVVAEWMASPTHRRNILDPTYTQIGVSHTRSGSGRAFWVQEFGV